MGNPNFPVDAFFSTCGTTVASTIPRGHCRSQPHILCHRQPQEPSGPSSRWRNRSAPAGYLSTSSMRRLPPLRSAGDYGLHLLDQPSRDTGTTHQSMLGLFSSITSVALSCCSSSDPQNTTPLDLESAPGLCDRVIIMLIMKQPISASPLKPCATTTASAWFALPPRGGALLPGISRSRAVAKMKALLFPG